MDQNRRRCLRKVPDDFICIQIERDEVGKVLNISEGGLSFNSFSPVPRNLPVYFWFSFNLKDRIEAMGEVAWTDVSRKIGGLRFTQLSQGGREQIQRWLSRMRPESQEVPEEGPVSQLVLAGKRAGSGRNGLDRVAKFVAKARAYRPTLFRAGGFSEIRRVVPPLVPGIESPKARTDRPMFSLEGVEPGASRVATAPELKFEPSKVRADRPIFSRKGMEPGVSRVATVPQLKLETPKVRTDRAIFSLEANSADLKVTPPPALEIEPSKVRVDRPMFSLEGAGLGDSRAPSGPLRGIESLAAGLVPLQRHLSAKKRQLLRGVFLGICISMALTVPALKHRNNRAQAENITQAATESPSLKSNIEVSTPTPAPAVPVTKPSSPVGNIFSGPPPQNKWTTPNLTTRTPMANSYRQDSLKAVVAKIPKPLAATPVPPPSGSAPTAGKKSSVTPKQLWGAVQAGSSEAAVQLAELYIKGQGVPQNCQQARVLLLVASEKRNAAAIKRLQELDKDPVSCP